MAGRIYVTGDTHGELEITRLSQKDQWPTSASNLDKSDYLIIAGDFGLVWNGGTQDQWWLDWLEEKPWTTLFVDGNHENHELLDAMPVSKWNGGKVHFVRPSVIHLMRGQIFNIYGNTIFTMGGASSHDTERRVPYVSWWPRELPSYAEQDEAIKNLEAHNWEIDYIISHETPASMIELMALPRDRYSEPDAYSRWLQELYERCDFKHYYHGHYHLDCDLTSKLSVVYRHIVELGDSLVEIPATLYDLHNAEQDFPWLSADTAAQIAELPCGWGDCVREALASFEQTVEVQNVSGSVVLDAIEKHPLGGLDLRWHCIEGTEIAECAASALKAVARNLWLSTNSTCQRCGRGGARKRGSWRHISCAMCHEQLEMESWR